MTARWFWLIMSFITRMTPTNPQKAAVIETGGKQYLVSEGEKIRIEKLEGKAGDTVKFDSVLLTAQNDDVKLGNPAVKGAVVEGKLIAQTRAKKLFGVKFKAKKRYMRVFGHKQHLSDVEITKISL